MSTTSHRSGSKWWHTAILLLFSPVLLVILPLAILLFILTSIFLRLAIWSCWSVRGRDVLFVYSDSPVWHDYIEQRILPHISERAVVLNWSQRKRWRFSLARMAFHHFGSYRQFNPLGVVFRPFGRTHTFRFWQPFRDLKHGHSEALQKMEAEFFQVLEVHRHETSA
jgi:hypothetical protein